MIKDSYGNTRFYGVYRGIVVDTTDPLKLKRLKLKVPQILSEAETDWAWPIESPGVETVLPNVGQGIWVQFEGGDPSYPIWIGQFGNIVGTIASSKVVGPTGPPGPKGDSVVLGVETDFVVAGGTTGTPVTFSGAPLFNGSYIKLANNLVYFQIEVLFTNITSFGTGQYFVNLPFPTKHEIKFRDGCLHDVSATREYALGGSVLAGSETMLLTSTDTQSGTVYDIPFTRTAPVTLVVADKFHIAGTYIAN